MTWLLQFSIKPNAQLKISIKRPEGLFLGGVIDLKK